jgi:cob(I)alamin adenosyltransferase
VGRRFNSNVERALACNGGFSLRADRETHPVRGLKSRLRAEARSTLYPAKIEIVKKFSGPRLALNRIYTRLGDAGDTALAGGQRVGKDSLRIEAYGTVDELSAFVGLACATCEELGDAKLAALGAILRRVQHELFNLGSILATLPQDVHPRQARVTEAEVLQLEREIDAMNEELPALRSFVLPGGTRLNAELHAARTICRRAERLVVALARQQEVPAETIQYLNRLSDALFVWSRWVNHALGVAEVLWEPNQAASGQIE